MYDSELSEGGDVPIDALMDAGIDFDTRETSPLEEPVIVRWRGLPDEDAIDAWQELRGFVDWLIGRYDISDAVIPRCWWMHGSIVEELSALRAAWDVSMDPDIDGGLGPIGWHERFHLLQSRLREWYNRECINGHITPLTGPEKDGYAGWDAWISEAHS